MNIRKRMIYYVFGTTILIVISIISILTWFTYNSSLDSAKELATSKSIEVSKEMEVTLEEGILIARNLANTFESMKAVGALDRDTANRILRDRLISNPKFLGVWTCWEPNAFDPFDSEFVNLEGYDQTGRFVPYWHRINNEITVAPLLEYDTPGPGDYYLLSLNSGEETIIEPYDYWIGDKYIRITSLVAPIRVNGEILGVAGVDFSMEALENISAGVKLYDSGFGQLITHNGFIVDQTLEKDVFSPYSTLYTESDISWIKEGTRYQEEIMDMNGKRVIRSYAPIQIGYTGTPWSFMTVLPYDEVIEQPFWIIVSSLLIGGSGMIIIALLLSYNAVKIIKPLSLTVELANSISDGNYNVTFPEHFLEKNDEVGMLAVSFNKMTSNLNNLIQGLNTSRSELEKHKIQLEIKVAERTQELEESLKMLTAMQDRLIEAEKISSLNAVVKGIAHEVNTPLGICITLTSNLQMQTELISDKLRKGVLSKSEIVYYLETLDENTMVLESSLNKISSLVKKFKETSVSSSSSSKHTTRLDNLLTEVIDHTYLLFPKNICQIKLDLEDNPSIYTSIEPWYKVFSNLISNSITHYDNNINPCDIHISTLSQDHNIIIVYEDNGPGIPNDIQGYIFDPFFTTNRAGEHSGLGLNVVFNEITYSFNGNIRYDTNYDDGARFIITIPKSELLKND